MPQSAEARLAAMGLTLPTPAAPIANYVAAVRTGSLVFVSGQLCFDLDGKLVSSGKLGAGADPELAKGAARFSAINVLAQLRAVLGSLDMITRVVRLGGFFAATPDYTQLPALMNGASDLMVEVFEEAGRHARTTVGVACLPMDATVEVEAIVEVG